MRRAILKLGHEKKINRTRHNEDDFSDKCDRILLSQFRTLKQKGEEYNRRARKAFEAKQIAIDNVLGIMNLDLEKDDEEKKTNV